MRHPQVVGILNPSRRRNAVVGVLSERGDGKSRTLLLEPRDARMPQMVVAAEMLPSGQRTALRRLQIDQVYLRPIFHASNQQSVPSKRGRRT